MSAYDSTRLQHAYDMLTMLVIDVVQVLVGDGFVWCCSLFLSHAQSEPIKDRLEVKETYEHINQLALFCCSL